MTEEALSSLKLYKISQLDLKLFINIVFIMHGFLQLKLRIKDAMYNNLLQIRVLT